MLGTIWTIITVLTNFWTLALILGLVAYTAAIYFILPLGGPPGALKFWLTPSTYMGIAGALCIIFMTHSVKTIEAQKQVIHQDAVQKATTTDGAAVLTDHAKTQQKNEQVKTRERHAIDTAKTGDEEDALFDQIAREQCSDPANSSRPDCLLKH